MRAKAQKMESLQKNCQWEEMVVDIKVSAVDAGLQVAVLRLDSGLPDNGSCLDDSGLDGNRRAAHGGILVFD